MMYSATYSEAVRAESRMMSLLEVISIRLQVAKVAADPCLHGDFLGCVYKLYD
jgi:hypothetical protein